MIRIDEITAAAECKPCPCYGKSGLETVTPKTKETQTKIMTAAYEIALKKGIKAITVREIAAKAKTSIGLIYYHFKDVPKIFEKIHLCHYEQIFHYLDEKLPGPDDSLLRFMNATTINIQFAASRHFLQNISHVFPFSHLTKDSQYFSLTRENINAIQKQFGLLREKGMPDPDAEAFAFIGAFEMIKSAYYRSQISPTPYQITQMVFVRTFTPMGLDANEIISRIAEVQKVCRNIKRKEIALPWLLSVHDDVPEFNQVTLHALGKPVKGI
ncbi:MAG: TetR/AcrR family transcriptional regulator [Deltaproteobacteria bacterium]|nr:TetR/AcrR family transcriptional regulator [Deltaproteobacteria bacterium]